MRTLAGLIEPLRQAASPHVWLPLGELEAERVAGLAMRAGVKLTSPRAPFAGSACLIERPAHSAWAPRPRLLAALEREPGDRPGTPPSRRGALAEAVV